jgi:hypothetical protein
MGFSSPVCSLSRSCTYSTANLKLKRPAFVNRGIKLGASVGQCPRVMHSEHVALFGISLAITLTNEFLIVKEREETTSSEYTPSEVWRA